MAKIKPQEEAQRTALQGKVEAAMTQFVTLERGGALGANVPLAEIAAYQGRWQEVMQRAEVLFSDPTVMFTHNTYVDMAMLVGRAGSELDAWNEAERLADFALSNLKDPERDAARIRTTHLLKKFAITKDEGSLVEKDPPEAQQKAEFASMMAGLDASKEQRFKKPEERRNRMFAFARSARYYAGAVELFDKEKALPHIFDNIVFAASALARAGRLDDAWTAIRSSLHLWFPVEVLQVAPIVLITNDSLRRAMTPARYEEVLRTPRGPEATKKK